MSIELHCHTEFSVDGSGTPEILVEEAVRRGVHTLSITEHNNLYSAARAMAHAANRGIRYLPGIEMDAVFEGRTYHFLGFGVDPRHEGLRSLAEDNHSVYRRRYDLQIEAFTRLFPITRQEVEESLPLFYPTHHAAEPSIFHLRSILRGKGLWDSGAERREEITRETGPGMAAIQFCDYEAARDTIRASGGLVLLAHVGKYFPDDFGKQEALIRKLRDEGLDGIEVYHHSNAAHSDIPGLLQLGSRLDCVMSGGSDCHHAPCEPPRLLGGCGAPDYLIAPLMAMLGY